MNDTEKSNLYSHLLAQHDKLSNQISSIKGEDINLNESQESRIRDLQNKQGQIMSQLQQLMR
jgi:hypothetical protein